ncbi:MAG: hypothetical protein IJ341_02825 [Bacteroidales bacterium]|nr:hypothetical protein [Bacteroidales bacterium]
MQNSALLLVFENEQNNYLGDENILQAYCKVNNYHPRNKLIIYNNLKYTVAKGIPELLYNAVRLKMQHIIVFSDLNKLKGDNSVYISGILHYAIDNGIRVETVNQGLINKDCIDMNFGEIEIERVRTALFPENKLKQFGLLAFVSDIPTTEFEESVLKSLISQGLRIVNNYGIQKWDIVIISKDDSKSKNFALNLTKDENCKKFAIAVVPPFKEIEKNGNALLKMAIKSRDELCDSNDLHNHFKVIINRILDDR